ncbi:pyocin activator PrtN family protein [Pseudomonas sp. B21-009]|uniref:pyocin activator PrtN family protein n=1 Tax=Pseudomonas sp. B21-009 TaxID=2895470 RepID=UPI00215FF2CB|nr:pyocin activator PrtN family protein [Pseudomonas sp. B21-009]UVM65304.1 pyocin activator PrtN family protein [Pseudomonas sp. B21-009]
MSETLAQLRRQWTTPCPTLREVREHYFPHIKTDQHLRKLINKGRIQLKLIKPDHSVRAEYVVYLHELAAYLDAQAHSAG